MSEFGKVEGKTFLITGGASGLGAGYVESFLKDGAKSVAILDISEQAGKPLVEKLNKVYPGKVIFIKCDVSNEENVTQAFNEVVDKFKTVDVLINNAGIMNDSPNIWRKATEVNVLGLVSLTLKGIKHMNKEEGGKGGTIINVSSIAGFMKNPCLPIYAGAKAAVLQFTHSIATGLTEDTGVRVMTMCFGATDTPLLHNMDKLPYDQKFGKLLLDILNDHTVQNADSAIKGVVETFKQGSHKSVWLATDDKPVQDITQLINNAYEMLQKAIYPSMPFY
ncbi:hypothetical protein ABMA27_004810 [Loxostege sticticalis]|uniref:15-hydroxyprostaglandin dehydrogenase [NAD(+)]-like n=1 Tax=Loxostege sticticalis TaxID=481309 RepID=A0ABR3HKQ8_LOXSC